MCVEGIVCAYMRMNMPQYAQTPRFSAHVKTACTHLRRLPTPRLTTQHDNWVQPDRLHDRLLLRDDGQLQTRFLHFGRPGDGDEFGREGLGG